MGRQRAALRRSAGPRRTDSRSLRSPRPDGRQVWVNFAHPLNDTVQVIDAPTAEIVHELRSRARPCCTWNSRRAAMRSGSRSAMPAASISTIPAASRSSARSPADSPSGIFFTARAHRTGLVSHGDRRQDLQTRLDRDACWTDWQRGLPAGPRTRSRPSAAVSDCGEDRGARAAASICRGAASISRIGATCRPNTVGASTLAALSPRRNYQDRTRSPRLINAEAGVNHSYLRENQLEHLVRGDRSRSRFHVDATLHADPLADRARRCSTCRWSGRSTSISASRSGRRRSARRGSRPRSRRWTLQARVPEDRGRSSSNLTAGLPISIRGPSLLSAAKHRVQIRDATCLSRIRTLVRGAGRVAVSGRRDRPATARSAGGRTPWWCLAGRRGRDRPHFGPKALAAVPGVTLCYQRRTVPGLSGPIRSTA